MGPGHYYSQHASALRAELGRAVARDDLRALHRRSPARHLLVAARQFLLLGLAAWGLVRFAHPLAWVPLAVVQGFTVFNFTVLLHEVVHHAVFDRRQPRLERLLAFLYAIPSGISASQFTRWHLDHHAELGSAESDPKRHHLSPKRNARWVKLLYCTPALFPIYFRAARLEAATYPPALQRRIRGERLVYGEAEYRWTLTKNGLFGMVAFLNTETLSNDQSGERLFDSFATGAGFGFRFMLNKRSQTNLCLDIGFGKEGSSAVYFAVQEAF